MADRRNSSPSPRGRNTLSNQISSIGAKINRALSGDRLGRFDADRESLASTVVSDGANANERSVSRGRQGFSSSGRGGIGNIHQNASTSPVGGLGDVVRGRDRGPDPDRVISTGRGGIGNIRTPIAEQISSDAASSKSVPLSNAPTLSNSDDANNSYSRSRSRGPPLTVLMPNDGGETLVYDAGIVNILRTKRYRTDLGNAFSFPILY
ncbi:hypothetical protein Moror_10363 [Moniliophthora roreri MCA 2997]|uniref:Uncharacterized protein n=1 Tax=Moniliophthora roreri (strain MCA 2997) TaxID=1381753 RepID=V2XE48_MONRO|nr:hypothetical protein Moror_10363 [Moniliophthora roreri MCA 2997]